jgi:mannose-1-phosphate guanylyltransferase
MKPSNKMKAILLAAGFGSRLAPLTDNIPKCLVPINGKPLLGIWIDKLIALGVTEILINTHYLSSQVFTYVQSHPYKEYITLIHETNLLGTAGTLVSNQDFWKDDTCFVIHADNYCGSDLSEMVKAHNSRSSQALATLLLFETQQPESCGIVRLDPHNFICEFYEKQPALYGNLASGALFIFSPAVYARFFSTLKLNTFYELSIDIIPKMLGQIQGWKVDSFYLDIGTPANYELAQSL